MWGEGESEFLLRLNPFGVKRIEKKKINVLVKECFRAVLLKPVEGMRDRWAG